MKKGLSIIIPTYKTPEYLFECIDSILNQTINFNYEIIIGIDNCEETLQSVKTYKKNNNIRFFYFTENVGPYIIRNNLVSKSLYDDLLFFDSDDLLINDMLQTIYDKLEEFKYVRLNFINFIDSIQKNNFTTTELAYGVFGINKELFEKFVGFESWICNADVEFHERLRFNHIISHIIKEISFYRRIHQINLTQKSDTSLKSQIRREYRKLISQKEKTKNWSNPIKIIKEHYEL